MSGESNPATGTGVGGKGLAFNSRLRFLFLPGFEILGRGAGIVALVISLAHPAVEAWRDFRRTAATTVSNSTSYLVLWYDPVQRLLKFEIPAVVSNDGTREDQLNEGLVSMTTFADGTTRQLGKDVSVSSASEDEIILPYVVQLRRTRVTFWVRALLDSTVMPVIRAAGARRLVLNLKDEKNQLFTLSYCFQLTDDQINGLLTSDTVTQKRFITTTCE